MKLSHNITVTVSVSTQNSTSNIVVILSFKIVKIQSKIIVNERQPICTDRFPFNKSPILESMFSTGTEDSACPWPAPAVAKTCSNCCARKKADRHLLLLVHTVCTPLSGRGVWHLGDFATRRCVSESVSFSCSEQSLICRCCSCWTEWTLQCCCRRYCYQRPETENRYKLLWLYVFHDVVG